jgi:hypothetical protein
MWPLNSQNIPNISSKPIKNNITEEVPLYQTPIKQSLNIQRSGDTPPLQFDFNFYFGNLWSSGHIPAGHVDISMNNSVNQHNRETNMLLFKSSMEKSGYKLTPMSEVKNINNSNIIEYGMNNNNLSNIYENDLNQNEFTKKNLAELFNNAKNDEFLRSNKKFSPNLENNLNNNNFTNNIYYPNSGNNFSIIPNNNNTNLINSSNNIINNIPLDDWENDNNKENKNPNNINIINKDQNNNTSNNNFISKEKAEEMFDSPINKKPKKIFECSGSSITTNSSKSSARKRRFRKNNEQLFLLSQFFNEHKHWSKNQIKEISIRTGLKENKVYKWLWDQRNKEYKTTKFIINKKNPP